MSTIRELVQEMLDKLWPELNDPLSNGQPNPLYLPAIIQKEGYDPYAIGSWTLGFIDVGTGNRNQICGPTGQIQQQNWIDSTSTPNPYVLISSATLIGVSNIEASTATAVGSGYTILAKADLSVLPTHPRSSTVTVSSEISISGSFELHQWCCVTTDFVHCASPAPPPDVQVGTGSFAAVIPKSRADLWLEITSLAPDVFQLAVTSVSFVASTVAFSANITSVPRSQQAHWNTVANQALNSGEATGAMIDHINDVMNQPNERNKLGDTLTQKIDAYLKENHKYPFDNPHEAIF